MLGSARPLTPILGFIRPHSAAVRTYVKGVLLTSKCLDVPHISSNFTFDKKFYGYRHGVYVRLAHLFAEGVRAISSLVAGVCRKCNVIHQVVWCCRLRRYIEYCMHRVNMLRHFGVQPVLVFDGGGLPMKSDQEIKRARYVAFLFDCYVCMFGYHCRCWLLNWGPFDNSFALLHWNRSRKENLERAIEHERLGNHSAANECYQKAVDITPGIAFRLIQVPSSQWIFAISASSISVNRTALKRLKMVNLRMYSCLVCTDPLLRCKGRTSVWSVRVVCMSFLNRYCVRRMWNMSLPRMKQMLRWPF